MRTVGIRALKQNASALVAEAASGETVTITDRGRPVARMTAVPTAPLQSLIEDGRARASLRQIRDLPAPPDGPPLTAILNDDRDGGR
jgi:prevent-host-death family protein